jgi:hypothetical protein
VELHLVWRRSSRCNAVNSNCIEVAAAPRQIAVRDSTNIGPMLRVGPHAWAAFVTAVQADRISGSYLAPPSEAS